MTGARVVRVGSSIFNADHGHLADVTTELDRAGIDFIHWDVFDGHFIPELGFPPRTLQAVRPLTGKPFEVHLAASNIRNLINPLVKSGANLIFVPVESTPLLYEGIALVREAGLRVGVSLALCTPVSAITEALPYVDSILVLSRVYGETVAKAQFMPRAIRKVEAIRTAVERDGLEVDIEVAGSLSIETARTVVAAGATSVVFGGTLHKAADLSQRLSELRNALGSTVA